ncbi:MAG: hypothetical protein NT108_03550 [Candidatus Kaiserbacteria bacterium]|nr:hypothetical protein [Candidatus Kaiserbacteria bacterium]
MQSTSKQWLTSSIVLLVGAVIIGGLWYGRIKAPAPEPLLPEALVATSTTPTVATTTVSVAPKSSLVTFPINSADTIISWSFKGTYSGNEGLIAKATADSAYLKGLLGKGKYDDYDLYVGIGNNDGSVGDGAGAYQNYNRAIALDPGRPLAYANLGHLMDQLGAYHTAAAAYAKAVMLAPSIAQYRNAQLDFLTQRFPEEAARLKAKQ